MRFFAAHPQPEPVLFLPGERRLPRSLTGFAVSFQRPDPIVFLPLPPVVTGKDVSGDGKNPGTGRRFRRPLFLNVVVTVA